MMPPIDEDDRIALNALVDGELDSATALALQSRIASDPSLQAARDEIAAARDSVLHASRPELTAAFRERIMAMSGAPAKPAIDWMDGWRSIAAAVVITALLASSATWLLVPPRGASIETMIASAHRRSLLAASPVDVLSSDRHTVKPWLDGRLGVSPPAPDLVAAGYPLLGGRVEVLGQQAVPVLVYRHNEHTISVVAVPGGAGTQAARSLALGGYNMIEWAAAGFAFVAVSDLEPAELASFVADYQTASSG